MPSPIGSHDLSWRAPDFELVKCLQPTIKKAANAYSPKKYVTFKGNCHDGRWNAVASAPKAVASASHATAQYQRSGRRIDCARKTRRPSVRKVPIH
jgi:hypothetical protein